MGKSKKPDLIVKGRSLTGANAASDDGRHWKKIGVGWSGKSKNGSGYFRLVLDFVPNTNELTIWSAEDGADDTKPTRFTRVAEEMEKS